MIAGSSTGSILTAALTIPKEEGSKEPKMYANDVVKYFEREGPVVFKT
jgi:patatin-like phospholipase/acyl hydrolase